MFIVGILLSITNVTELVEGQLGGNRSHNTWSNYGFISDWFSLRNTWLSKNAEKTEITSHKINVLASEYTQVMTRKLTGLKWKKEKREFMDSLVLLRISRTSLVCRVYLTGIRVLCLSLALYHRRFLGFACFCDELGLRLFVLCSHSILEFFLKPLFFLFKGLEVLFVNLLLHFSFLCDVFAFLVCGFWVYIY